MGHKASGESDADCSSSSDEEEAVEQATPKAAQTQAVSSATPGQISKRAVPTSAAQPVVPVTATLTQALVNGGRGCSFNCMFAKVSINRTYHKDGSIKSESVVPTWNTERLQCSRCKIWLADKAAKASHNQRCNSGCSVHSKCFSHEDNVMHAKDHAHNRCFIRGCVSKYREEDGWKPEEILSHVRGAHGILRSNVAS